MNLRKALYQTIVFFDLFDFPLTGKEIQENLYGAERPVHIKEIEGTLNEIPGIEKIQDYYVLKGRENLIEIRKSRKFFSEKFWNKTKFYGHHMRRVPFVRMVSVCNNLSYDNPSESSDIDLYIVIEPGRMWTARFFLTILLHFFGVRRYKDKVAGRFCLSFFATPQKMLMQDISIQPDDPYLAYWLKHLSPIYGIGTYEELKAKNADFMKRYGLYFGDSPMRHLYADERSSAKKLSEKMLQGKMGDALENLLKRTLKKRTLRKFKELGPEASVVVSDDMLKFHNLDRRKEYRDKWQQRVEELMKLPMPSQAEE